MSSSSSMTSSMLVKDLSSDDLKLNLQKSFPNLFEEGDADYVF